MGKVLIFITIIASLVLNGFLVADKIKSNQKNLHLVSRVIDGDTFETSDKKLIRLLGVEAPELGLCGSDEAKKQLESLILNKKITFSASTNDIFRRLVADVYIDNNKSVNVAMIESGWAAYDSSDSSVKEEMRLAGENVRKEKIGIFGDKCTQISNSKCKIKGNINDGRETKIYEFPGCGRYELTAVELFRGDQWFCSEKEAMDAGFVKSKNCFGRSY